MVRDHYVIFQYFFFRYHLCMILFCYYLRKKLSSLGWSLWYSLKLMKLPGRDRCRIPSEHTSFVRLMYIQFRLCVHVNVKRTNIFHKCSECYRVWVSRFKNHAVVQKSCSSSSGFHSSKVISKLYFTDSNERKCTPLQLSWNIREFKPWSTFWQ